MPVSRIDADDEVYRSAEEKNEAIIKLVIDCDERGQPVLVGTTSIEKVRTSFRFPQESANSSTTC